jgi:hypothetical protein
VERHRCVSKEQRRQGLGQRHKGEGPRSRKRKRKRKRSGRRTPQAKGRGLRNRNGQGKKGERKRGRGGEKPVGVVISLAFPFPLGKNCVPARRTGLKKRESVALKQKHMATAAQCHGGGKRARARHYTDHTTALDLCVFALALASPFCASSSRVPAGEFSAPILMTTSWLPRRVLSMAAASNSHRCSSLTILQPPRPMAWIPVQKLLDCEDF